MSNFLPTKEDAKGPAQEFEGSAGKGTSIPSHEGYTDPKQANPGSAAKGKKIPSHESVGPKEMFGNNK